MALTGTGVILKDVLKSYKGDHFMRRIVLVGSLVIALPLALILTLVLQPTRATSEEAKSSPTEVRVDNFRFDPETFTVPTNSNVTWVNKDDVLHVIASNEGIFKSKALDTNDKYSYTFAKAGTCSYYCSIYPKMVGKIIVQ
jgi:plastocyanin